MKNWIIGALTGGVLAAASAGLAWAQYGFPVDFDSEAPVKLVGTVDFVEWVNPHAYVHVTVPDVGRDGAAKPGTTFNWALTTDKPNVMFKLGLTKETLVKGVKVTIDGFQSKDGLCSKKWRTTKPLEISTCKAIAVTMTFANGCTIFTAADSISNAKPADLKPCTPPKPQM